MDLKDLSSNSIAVNRNGSLADDDGATAGLARDASVAFHSGKFEKCVQVLNQLLQKKDDDQKVLHNVAIARYFRDGCSDPKKLLEALNNVKKRSDELVHASGEHAEVSNMGNKAALGSKGTNSMTHQLSSANNSHIAHDDEFDASVTMLNIAVIGFHLHEYAKVHSILDSLYQKIEPIDEATALHICLLFLDVALASLDPWKFVDVISYVEKAYCASNLISQIDNGSSSQRQSSNLAAKTTPLPCNSTTADASNSDSVAGANALERNLYRTLSEENLETLISNIDMSGQNLARPSGLRSTNDLSRTPDDHSISNSALRLKLQLYKVRLLLLTRNLKTAKREVKLAMTMDLGHGKDSSMALLLKSQLEYARGNYRKAIKLLMASSNRMDLGISSIHNNNLGCIYYRLGKYHTSSIFFSKALSNSSSLRKEKPIKLSTFSQDKSLQIIYNCGVQYLACGKPILAAHCFYKASLIFYDRPLLWLRIAECCLMAREKGLLKSSATQSNRSEVKVHVIGNGKWRQLAVEDAKSRNLQVDFVGRDDWFLDDDKQPNLSLSLARQCLFNALYLLNCSESKYSISATPHSSTLEASESTETESSKNTSYKSVSGGDSKASGLTARSGQTNVNGNAKEQKGENSSVSILQSSILDYEDICRRENWMIKQALLADLAYVELELENPLKALSTARSLLELPERSRIYIFLGNVYKAESLCLLNQPKEAAEHLLIYLSGGSNVELPYSEGDCKRWRAEKIVDCEESNGGLLAVKRSSLDESQDVVFLKPEEARGTLYGNLAVMFALQGDLEQAHLFVTQALSTMPSSPEALVTAIYVDLMIGKTQDALAQLKQCSRVRFLPGSHTLKSSC